MLYVVMSDIKLSNFCKAKLKEQKIFTGLFKVIAV